MHQALIRPPPPPSAAASPPAPEIQAAMGEYAVKFPEGWQPNPEELTSARDLFRSLELNPRQGGALLAHYVRLQERHAAADSDRIDQWERQIAADAELGGNRLSLTTANARAAVERFGDTKLKESLSRRAWAATRSLSASSSGSPAPSRRRSRMRRTGKT